MNLKEQWTPEAGKIYKLKSSDTTWSYDKVTVHAVCGEFAWVSDVSVVDGSPFTCNVSKLRPIQSEADKYRDEQIEAIESAYRTYCNACWVWEADGRVSEHPEIGKHLYQQGVRVLSPDEHICKPLTDEQKDRLCSYLQFPAGHKFVDAVQRELGLIEEK